MWVVTVQLVWDRMICHRRVDGCVIFFLDPALSEQRAQLGQCFEFLHRIAAVPEANPVVSTRDVVKVHGGPKARTFFMPAGRLKETKCVHHYASDVCLSMEQACMREEFWCRYQAR